MRQFTLAIVFLSLLGCADATNRDDPPSKTGMKTGYGKTVERTRDLSSELSQRDAKVKEQADEIFDR